MYIVNDDLPKNCLHCPYTSKCNVCELIVGEMSDDEFMDFPTPKPMQYPCCRIIATIPRRLVKFYRKWIKGWCRHLCVGCRHRRKCDIYNSGRDAE